MRELTNREIEVVSGGVFNIGSGLVGAGLAGIGAGGAYAVHAATHGVPFSWGSFATETASAAASGFLIGSGGTLLYAGITGAMRGASVAGVSLAGAGGAMMAAQAAGSPGAKGGGSE